MSRTSRSTGSTGASTTRAPSTRREKALVTRRRMLEAAFQHFSTRGYAATTMQQIADDAGVAVQTLYFTFHSKSAILGEVIGAAVVGFDRWMGPIADAVADDPEALAAHAPWYDAVVREPDPRRALAVFVQDGAETMERVAPLAAILAAPDGDPELQAIARAGERRRNESFRVFVSLLAKKGGLRPGLGVARATDILLVLFSPATLRALLARGWTSADARRFLVDVIASQLLIPGR